MRHLAYVTGAVIHDTRTGLTHASGNRDRVIYSKIHLPPNAPEWAVRLSQHTADFWNFRSVSEDRLNPRFVHDASLYFEYVIALPRELTVEQNIELVRDLVAQVFHPFGLAVQISVHWDNGNPHVHLVIADRALTEDGWSKRKHRIYNRREGLKTFRETVATFINTAYQRLEIDEQVTHLSHKDRGLRLEATLHEGPQNDRAHNDIASDNAAIRQRNKEAVIQDPSIIIAEVASLKNVFTAKDLSQTLLKRLDGDHDLFETLYPQVLTHPELVPLTLTPSSGSQSVYTTQEHHRNEAKLLATARTLNASTTHALAASTVETIIAGGHTQSKNVSLLTYSDEQASAIRRLTQGSDLALLHGRAGTGKTTVLSAVARSYQQAGYTVVGMALSGVAAQNLAQEAGLEAKTIHRWMQDWHLNATHRATLATSVPDDTTFQVMMRELERVAPSQLTDRHVVILDEASMVDPRQFHRILEQASLAKAKVICVGDTAQLGSVTYGAPFRALKERLDQDSQAVLSTVYRQKVPWMREASEVLHQQIDEGLLTYAQKGHITEVHSRTEAIDAVAACYLQGFHDRPERSHIALSATRAGASALNHAIRRALLEEDRSGAYVAETVPAFGREFRVKDRIVLTQNATRMWIADGQTVTDPRELGRIYNGDRGTIQAIHVLPDTRVVCEVALDRGGIAIIDSSQYTDMDHGYAVTVHKSQGITVDHSYVLLDQGFRRNTAYVAFTRHRYGVQAVYGNDQFKDYGALEQHLLKDSFDRMIVDYSLDEGEQQVADRLYRYQELIRTMATHRQRIAAQRDAGPFRLDREYRALKQERSTLALQLTEDWSDTHDRLCGQMGLNKQRLYQAAGIKTAYERKRERKVLFYIQRLRAFRHEAEALRNEMGAIPYRWDEPIVQRLIAVHRESDRLAEQLLSYRELRSQIEGSGLSWVKLQHQATRSNYRRQRDIYYLELSDENRAKAREVRAFAQEAQLLRWQYQAMVKTHSDITHHMAYDGYAKRQQGLNATATGFVDAIEEFEHLLVKEGINPTDLHTRAAVHRIQQRTQSNESIHSICLGIAHEIDMDPALRNRGLQVQLGLTLPQGLQPKTVTEHTSRSSPVASSNKSLGTAPSAARTPSTDISSLCTEFRRAWDHYEAVKVTTTLGTQPVVHPNALKEAQRQRDHRAAQLVAATHDRSRTPFSEKQWAAVHAFATAHTAFEAKAATTRRSFDELNQALKDRMPQLCDTLLSERPTQQRPLEWRYGSKGSLKVTVAGQKAGSFVNFETGERGDPIQFIATQRQCDRASAIEWARQFVGEPQRTPQTSTPSSIRTAPAESKSVEHRTCWISQTPPKDQTRPDMNAPALKKIYTQNNETARYTYTDAEGHPLFYVVRFEPKTLESKTPTLRRASKMTLPLSYGSDQGSPAGWRYKKYIAPNGAKTPLYNLKELTDRLDAPVLIVEGEKAAEAAKHLFPDMVVTTWQGGASAVHASDWTPLQDREVIIWPDNDIAGQKAAEQIKARCEVAGVKDATIIDVAFEKDQPALPPKWDLADALPQGLTLENIQMKVTSALSTIRTKLNAGVTLKTAESPFKTKTSEWDFGLGD
jgi:ATP-dependent exoDNAse (exonuclease V) alpha subunit/5S rRNA maturation endonuclease (ribonuclease M5)